MSVLEGNSAVTASPGSADVAPATLAGALLDRLGDSHPGLRHGDLSWTWDAVVREGGRRAVWLREQRGRAGRPLHVGVLLDNGPEYLFALAGIALSGDVLVALNTTRSLTQLDDDAEHSDVDLVLASARYTGSVAASSRRVIDVADSPWPGSYQPADSADGPAPADLFSLMFTSGSTSRPKAVRHSHGRLLARGRQLLGEVDIDRSSTVYLHMPLFHASTMVGLLLPALLAGATIATRERFSASGFVPDLHRYGATHTTFVGKTLQYILARTTTDERKSTLQLAVGNGASDRDIARFSEVFGCRVHDVYGSTEGGISLRRVAGTPSGSIGVATAGDVRVLDPVSARECPRAEVDETGRITNLDDALGEIVRVDGTGSFEGYYENPAAERARLRDGYFWSGDLAWRDTEGYFFFAGRSGDMVRVDGENISAHRVQDRIETHPDVQECAVYGIREAHSDDHLMVTAVLRTGAPADPNLIFDALTGSGQLSDREVPRFVRLARTLPRTPTNKLLVEPLRRQGLHSSDPVWWRPSTRAPFVRLSTHQRDDLAGPTPPAQT